MRLLILIPFLIVLVLFALSNQATVRLGVWPTDLVLFVPMSMAILVGMGAAFLIGALFVWPSAIGQATRARRAEGRVRTLESEMASLRARMTAPPPTSSLTPLGTPDVAAPRPAMTLPPPR